MRDFTFLHTVYSLETQREKTTRLSLTGWTGFVWVRKSSLSVIEGGHFVDEPVETNLLMKDESLRSNG